jgi:hypothetical protein
VSDDVVTLFRPVGPEELSLIEQSGFRSFPPRLPEQPIFYPVLTEEYATKIARDWNVPASGSGYVKLGSKSAGNSCRDIQFSKLAANNSKSIGYQRTIWLNLIATSSTSSRLRANFAARKKRRDHRLFLR